ncbi:MAG: sensor histidine kinase [Bacteroidetes bacterium]|nr:sensor histidine kinase [Bacteroidota bacterium]
MNYVITNLSKIGLAIFIGLLLCLGPEASAKKPRLTKAQSKQRRILKDLKSGAELKEFNRAINHATNIGAYLVADSLIDRSRPILRRTDDSLQYYEHLRLKARLYTILNRYPEALDYFKQSLLYYQGVGRWQEEGQVAVNLVEFYRSSGLFKEGIDEAKYLINHPSFEDLSSGVKATVYHRLAAIMNEGPHNLDSVIILSEKSLSYSEPDSILGAMGTSYLEVGYAYAQKKESRAVFYFQKAFAVFKEQGRVHYMCNALLHIASYLMRVENNQQALSYIDSAISMAKPYYLPGFYPVALEKKAKLYNRLGRHAEAYYYRDSAAVLFRDDALRRFTDKLAIQSRRFQTEISESRLKALESERNQVLEESRNQSLIQKVIFSSLILSVILFVGLYYFFSRLKRSRDNLEISEKALHGANQELINTLDEKDGLIEEVHHRVKNNLQLITSLIKVQQFQQKDNMSEQSQQVVGDILSRVSAMAVVHEKLYSQENVSQLQAKEYFSELISELKTIGGLNTQRIKIEIEASNVALEASDGIALGMICTELVANSLKYAFDEVEKPLINIAIEKISEGDSNRVFFTYRDNGNGFREGSEMGMGNRLIILFSRQLEGEYQFETEGRFYFNLNYLED